MVFDWSPTQLASIIDHTFLRPFGAPADETRVVQKLQARQEG